MLLRSRAGCPRCRSMKIKCDETKPSCRQCLRRKIICPGYKRDLRWSDKHEVFSTGRWEDAPAQDAPPTLSISSLLTATADLPGAAFEPGLSGQRTQTLPAQSLGSATDAGSSSQTPPQQVDNPSSVAFPATGNKFSSYEDRSSTDVFREDLREWLASHEPMTLLEQQDWTWTLGGLPLNCDEPSTLVTTLDCRIVAASQGSELNQSLVQYFFDNLCCIHTVLDDTAERFKALVHRYLSSSPLLHKSIVCMSAAHCFQDDESMLPMCLECHSAAVRSLSEAVFEIETVIEESTDSPRNAALAENNMLRKLEETLLASIILGFCAPWSDPRDLALPHLRGARKLCEYLINYVTMDGIAPEKALANTDHHFLIGAMAYWEACMAFVVDQPKSVVRYLHPFCHPTEITYIHMFAGISLPLFVTLARVGICVRQNKALRNMAALGWRDREAYQSFASEVLQDAIALEKWAGEYYLPADETFDTKSLGSSTYRQLKAFAQMCKFSILLELRRNFPSLVDPQFDHRVDKTSSTANTHSLSQATKLDRWYFDLSGAILKHAQDIPEGSTCGLYQTILLIICGSVLRPSKDIQRSTIHKDLSLQDQLEAQVLSTLARQDEIDERRTFVRRRLQTNCASFGLRQVYSRAELLLEDVWREFDSGSNESENLPPHRHWIDVMTELKLETFFG